MASDDNDFDPFSDEEPPESESSAGSSSLMRGSIIVASISGIVIFLTAVTASNSASNSSAENTALAINQVARVALLVGFVGVLLAFRWPQIKQALGKSLDRGSERFRENRESEEGDSPLSSPAVIATDSGNKAELRLLFGFSIISLLMYWGSVFAIPTYWGSSALLVSEGVQLIFTAIMATLAVFVRGPVRGFAIGGLTVFLSSRLSSMVSSIAYLGMYSNIYSGNAMEGIWRSVLRQHAVTVTTALIAATICAGLVVLIESINSKQRQD